MGPSTATRSRRVMRQSSAGVSDEALDEYWKAFADDDAPPQATSSSTAPATSRSSSGYDLAELGRAGPARLGRGRRVRPVAGAHRFERELPDTELVVVDGRAGTSSGRTRPPSAPRRSRGFLVRDSRSSGGTAVRAWRSRARVRTPRRSPASRWPRACGRHRWASSSGQEHLLGAGLGAAHRDRGGPAALDDPLRAARHRQDDARPAARRERPRRVRGGVGGERRAGPRCAR